MIPIVDLKRQYKQTGAEIEKAVVEVLREWFDTRFANGKNNIPTRQER